MTNKELDILLSKIILGELVIEKPVKENIYLLGIVAFVNGERIVQYTDGPNELMICHWADGITTLRPSLQGTDLCKGRDDRTIRILLSIDSRKVYNDQNG